MWFDKSSHKLQQTYEYIQTTKVPVWCSTVLVSLFR